MSVTKTCIPVCLQGVGLVVGYCGDGINDLPALHAAHVGLAIGASHAVMAASVLSLSGSVMGMAHFSATGI